MTKSSKTEDKKTGGFVAPGWTFLQPITLYQQYQQMIAENTPTPWAQFQRMFPPFARQSPLNVADTNDLLEKKKEKKANDRSNRQHEEEPTPEQLAIIRKHLKQYNAITKSEFEESEAVATKSHKETSTASDNKSAMSILQKAGGLYFEFLPKIGSLLSESQKQIAGIGMGTFEALWEIGEGLVNMAEGAWDLTVGWLMNPEASQQTLDHLLQTLQAIYDSKGLVLVDAILDPIRDDWNRGNYGEAVGRVLVEIAGITFGAKGADKLSKSEKVAAVTGKITGKIKEAAKASKKLLKREEIGGDVATGASKILDTADDATDVASKNLDKFVEGTSKGC